MSQLKKDDSETSEVFIRKAHTYAYFGRQVAKKALALSDDNKRSSDRGSDDGSWKKSLLELEIFPFDFFPSFLQCSHYCGDFSVEESELCEETLEILSKLSEEERIAINVLISNKRTSYCDVSFTKLADCALKS